MTNAQFAALPEQLGISRAELCRQIGISLNSGTAYAKDKPVPLTVRLAIAAIRAGLEPA